MERRAANNSTYKKFGAALSIHHVILPQNNRHGTNERRVRGI